MDKPDDPIEKLRKLQKQHTGKVTPIKRRLIENSVQIGAKLADDILFQHTVFCQTVLPYRDPGPEVRIWEREQGNVKLYIKAGEAYHPKTKRLEKIGLPFGTAARLILCRLNTEALRTGSPVIEIDGSMTAFMQPMIRMRFAFANFFSHSEMPPMRRKSFCASMRPRMLSQMERGCS